MCLPVLVVVAAFTPVLWFGCAHGVPKSKLSRLHPGMSSDEVRELLGEPSQLESQRWADGSQRWVYDRHTFCSVSVHLSHEGAVTEIVHDH